MSQQKKSHYRPSRAESAVQREHTPRRHNIRVILSKMMLACRRRIDTGSIFLPFAFHIIAKIKRYAEHGDQHFYARFLHSEVS